MHKCVSGYLAQDPKLQQPPVAWSVPLSFRDLHSYEAIFDFTTEKNFKLSQCEAELVFITNEKNI